MGRRRRVKRRACITLLVVDAAMVAAVVADAAGSWRVVLALLFVSSVPGGALVVHRWPRDPAAAAAATVALSWAVAVLLNDMAVELAWWSPDTLLVAVGAASAASLGAALR